MTAAATSELPVEIRPMRQTDYQFVFETTVKVRWPRRASVPWWEWKQLHGPMVDHWIRAGKVRIATVDGVLLGFVVIAPTGVAMIYVKRGFRGDGIGLRLLIESGAWQPMGMLATMKALLPTPSWSRWCERRAVRWEQASC
jgi:hypothetical protein